MEAVQKHAFAALVGISGDMGEERPPQQIGHGEPVEEGGEEPAQPTAETAARSGPADGPPTDAPRKVPTRELHDVEEIDEVGPADEVPPT